MYKIVLENAIQGMPRVIDVYTAQQIDLLLAGIDGAEDGIISGNLSIQGMLGVDCVPSYPLDVLGEVRLQNNVNILGDQFNDGNIYFQNADRGILFQNPSSPGVYDHVLFYNAAHAIVYGGTNINYHSFINNGAEHLRINNDGSIEISSGIVSDGSDSFTIANVVEKESAIVAPDSQVSAQADAAVQTASYVQADVQSIADLANDLKAKYNDAVALINELKAKLDAMNA